MKKILIFVLLFVMIILAGCGASSKEVSSECVTTLTIKINPEFKLYINDKKEVIQIDALNDDAKKMMDGILIKDGDNFRDFSDVLGDILNAAKNEGFLKDNAEVSIEIIDTDQTEGFNKALLSDFTGSVNICAQESGINISASTSVAEHIQYKPDDPAPQEKEVNEVTPPAVKDDICDVCNGTGKCLQCNGEGKCVCRCGGTGLEDCRCGGTGIEICRCGGDGIESCGRCEGKGYEVKPDATFTCGQCNGTGEVVCGQCGGSGYCACSECGGTGAQRTCMECQGSGTTTCYPCDGTGICPHCQGTGKK